MNHEKLGRKYFEKMGTVLTLKALQIERLRLHVKYRRHLSNRFKSGSRISGEDSVLILVYTSNFGHYPE